MTDGDFVFQNGRMSFCRNVNDARVLNIRAFADAYIIDIAAQDTAIPDARIFADLDIADDDGIFSNENAFVNFRLFVLKIFYHKWNAVILDGKIA